MPLAGSKTYIVAIVFGLVTAAEVAGLVEPGIADRVREFLAAVGLITLRAGIAKVRSLL